MNKITREMFLYEKESFSAHRNWINFGKKSTEIKYFSAYNPVRILPRQPHSCFFFFSNKKKHLRLQTVGCGTWRPIVSRSLPALCCLPVLLAAHVSSFIAFEEPPPQGAATPSTWWPIRAILGDTWQSAINTLSAVGDVFSCFFLHLSTLPFIGVL